MPKDHQHHFKALMMEMTFSYITSTVKRAQILLLRASITPLRMVNPSPLMKSAISKKMPLSSQSICRGTHVNTSEPQLHAENKITKNKQQQNHKSLPPQASDEVGQDPQQ